jgi:anti-sigma regulatory factor (Ser/Thr protein kinase)
MLVNLPNRAYLSDLERFVDLIEDDGEPGLTVRMRDSLFSLHPMVLCMIAALTDRPYDAGERVGVTNVRPNASTRYLERMQLFEHMHLDSVVDVIAHESAGRFIPVTRISDNGQLNSFVTDLVPLLRASTGEADSVKYVLYELVRNVLEHAGSTHGAYAAAQVTKSGRLLIGIADSGIGILSSIRRFHSASTDQEGIKLAFRPGVTGTTSNYGGNETNGGAGLFFMKAMATLSRHHMVMVSGSSMMKLLTQPKSKRPEIHATLDDDRVKWHTLRTPFQGTAVGIDITVEETLDFSNLLTEIREVYHLNVRKSKTAKRKARFS